jgi:hypothetical protein
MLENWLILKDNIGQVGSEGGTIILDDELPHLARITVEQKRSEYPPGDHYAITIGIYNVLVHTAFFKRLEDARECTTAVKIIIQSLLENTMHGQG